MLVTARDQLEEQVGDLASGQLLHEMRCGATMLMNSRDVITLVIFQNFGKCRWLPVTR
jgi:hypothetical protein